MKVLFSNRQKYGINVMFCQILQFVNLLKTQQIKIFNCTEVFAFTIARVFLPFLESHGYYWFVSNILG